jgi:hypothetical protein
MKAGEAQVGQRVRTLVRFAAYPEVSVGTYATIVAVVAQNAGAQTDMIDIHPHGWPDRLCFPCGADDVELVC